MAENFENPLKSDELKELLEKYQKMLNENKSVYFEVEELILLAENYAGQRMPDDAEAVIDYGLKLHPESIELLIYRTQTLAAKGEYDQAVKVLDSIPEQNDREVLFTRATIYLRQSKGKTANDIFTYLAEEENFSSEVMTDIANVYLDEDKQKEAYEWLAKAYQLYPDSTTVKECLCDYYVTYEQYEKAAVIMTNLLDDSPYDIERWMDLGKVYLRLEQPDKAFEAIDFALAIDKRNIKAIELKAVAYLLSQNIGKGIELLEGLYRESKLGMESSIMLIHCYIQQKSFGKALLFCDESLQQKDLTPTEIAIIRSNRGYCNLMMNHPDECKDDVLKAISADSEYAMSYEVMGEYFLYHEDIQSAQSEFAYAEALATEKDEMMEKIAHSLFRTGYLEESIDMFKKLEAEYPKQMKNNYHFLALAYFYSNADPELIKETMIKAFYHKPDAYEAIRDMANSDDPREVSYYKLACAIKQMTEGMDYNDIPNPKD